MVAVGSTELLLCIPIVLILIALVAWVIMRLFVNDQGNTQNDASQVNQGSFEVVTTEEVD
tara:strand:- start:434 stop:613 length:180 start_codon:yes stop_codon:yes gene_type:complete